MARPTGRFDGMESSDYPEGDTLEFPEVIFERPVDVIAIPMTRLTPRTREILATSSTLRPGLELGSISASEWDELDAVAVKRTEFALATEMKVTAEGKDLMLMKRGATLTEPWIFLFGADYDSGRRYSLKAMVINPTRWTGLLPE